MSHGKMWCRKFGGDTELGQATCKPRSHPPQHPRSLPIFYSTKKKKKKRLRPRSRVPPCSSQSFKRVGEHIWQPLSARPLFVLQASLSSHKRLTTWLFKVRFKDEGHDVGASSEIWYKDEKDEDHVEIITIFLVMVVLQKEHSGSSSIT